MGKITDTVWSMARPIADELGVEIWDVEYVREAGTNFLRVYIDREEGISIEDCEKFSRRLDPLLDEKEPISESYTFEVSSAGAERQLKRPSDFERFIGSNVEVKLYGGKLGRREFIGKLEKYDDGAVEIKCADGTPMRFEKSEVANVRLRII